MNKARERRRRRRQHNEWCWRNVLIKSRGGECNTLRAYFSSFSLPSFTSSGSGNHFWLFCMRRGGGPRTLSLSLLRAHRKHSEIQFLATIDEEHVEKPAISSAEGGIREEKNSRSRSINHLELLLGPPPRTGSLTYASNPARRFLSTLRG